MRALWRHALESLILAAAIVSTGGPALATAPPAHSSAMQIRSCPYGTNWDNITHSCR